jgi:hypothetical protein
MKRRYFLLGAATAAAGAQALAASSLPQVEVYKNPDCGCCSGWVEHMKAAGFRVKVHETPDTSAVRKRHGIPDHFGSCHTGVVGGYALEGHVPAEEVKRLLAQKPKAAGLSVPGMPVGSPGMEMGSRKDSFQVLLIDKAGRSSVFANYPKTERRFT